MSASVYAMSIVTEIADINLEALKYNAISDETFPLKEFLRDEPCCRPAWLDTLCIYVQYSIEKRIHIFDFIFWCPLF